jgi:hypothetical protein
VTDNPLDHYRLERFLRRLRNILGHGTGNAVPQAKAGSHNDYSETVEEVPEEGPKSDTRSLKEVILMKKPALSLRLLALGLLGIILLSLSCSEDKVTSPDRSKPFKGLVAYWSLDEVSGSTVADGSGHGLYGIATGTTIVDGVVGKARAFNGVTDGIQVSNNDLLNITNEITLMLWARLDPSDAEGILLMKRLQNDSACEINYDIKYGFTPGHNFLAFQFGSGCTTGSNYIVTDVPGLSDGGWHHLAISFQFGSPASATWIIDGVEQPGTWTHWNGSPGGGTEIPPINSYPLTIGYQLSSSPALTKGTLDQIRIYNKALSKSEISAIYTQEKPNPIAQGLVAANANCIHLVSLTATGAAASSPAIGERAFMRHAIQDA